ncbi:CD225/dispanin family protein [Micromonospora echinofusca]|nr:CD225/dispanin family protein [Micromonospora echinofusca]
MTIKESIPMQPGYQGQPPQQIDNNMTMSIVAIFLFWPLAIPAIINASKVKPLMEQGDYAGAQAALAASKKWSKLALIVGIAWYVIALLCCVLGGVAGIMGGSTTTY